MKFVSKLLLLVLMAGLGISCERDRKKPGFEILPEMVHSVPYDAFAPNPNTKTGQTLLAPPKGTIPRGHMPYPFENTPEGAERAGRELLNPVPFNPEALARGQVVYENFCLICHGVTGKGDGPLIPKYPNPPSFTSKNVRNLAPGRLYHVITMGSGEMAAYASQIGPKDRWMLVYHLQSLQGKKPGETSAETRPTEPETQETPPSRKEEKANFKSSFMDGNSLFWNPSPALRAPSPARGEGNNATTFLELVPSPLAGEGQGEGFRKKEFPPITKALQLIKKKDGLHES